MILQRSSSSTLSLSPTSVSNGQGSVGASQAKVCNSMHEASAENARRQQHTVLGDPAWRTQLINTMRELTAITGSEQDVSTTKNSQQSASQASDDHILM
jgi:hypothetical protein